LLDSSIFNYDEATFYSSALNFDGRTFCSPSLDFDGKTFCSPNLGCNESTFFFPIVYSNEATLFFGTSKSLVFFSLLPLTITTFNVQKTTISLLIFNFNELDQKD